jgi:hypothetical protein
MWITTAFEARIDEYQLRLFMMFDCAFVGVVSNALARHARARFERVS